MPGRSAAPQGSGGGIPGGELLQGPALQQQHPAQAVHGPFDVLRSGVGFFQRAGQPRQLQGLPVRQGRFLRLRLGHGLAPQALALVGHGARSLALHHAFAQGQPVRQPVHHPI